MKNKALTLALAGAMGVSSISIAQDKNETKGYLFVNEIHLGHTPVKSQDITGTCWSFSTTSFLESELLRMGKGPVELSEMYSVYWTYMAKADNYVRRHGATNFGEGSLSHDMINIASQYGLMPFSVYSGYMNSDSIYNHRELSALLKSNLETIVSNPNGQLSTAWLNAYQGILSAYMQTPPTEFNYEGNSYTPDSFRAYMGIEPEDYISITSFNHHPFYSEFILEVPDNWSNASYYNVELDELIATIDEALKNGFTLAWDADVSEKTWSRKKDIAIWPATPYKEMSKEEKADLFEEVIPEMEVTQEIRQEGFDNYTTTDDHLMHIVGTAFDQNGNKYYLVKNSWGSERNFEGFVYVSESYMRMKTIAIMLHKDGVSKELKSKLNIQ